MKPPQHKPHNKRSSLWTEASAAGNLSGRFLCGPNVTVALSELVHGSVLNGRAAELRGRSVLVATADQLTAALALIELDGIASRLVLYPGDLPAEHVPFIVETVPVDAIVSDRPGLGAGTSAEHFVTSGSKLLRDETDRTARHETEWILLTSGTTGRPKLVVHTLESLAGGIIESALAGGFVWSTFYDIRRYGGLQIFLRAILTGGSLVLSSPDESIADFMTRVGSHGVTHISGTPSHWRKALMSPAADKMSPKYVRLSGEISDQAILDNLQSFYPQAGVAHAFASTEAGLAFDVRDGLAGFPANLVGATNGDVEMKIVDDALQIRSSRTAERYLGPQTLKDADGFVNTGDMLELRGDRYHFVGRRDGVINVGGLKVHPEEVEAVINRHPKVRISVVRTRKSPITGALVVADVVLSAPANGQARQLETEILDLCRGELARHKVPASIRFVTDLPVAATGKVARSENAR
ncbi:MAG TPA: long-chain fatty acid--CoA ligase [Bryobacteraceae bacterium]|nr:long-chain fatty acid--CoA ligase [Bryobacteraceae bacterium]